MEFECECGIWMLNLEIFCGINMLKELCIWLLLPLSLDMMCHVEKKNWRVLEWIAVFLPGACNFGWVKDMRVLRLAFLLSFVNRKFILDLDQKTTLKFSVWNAMCYWVSSCFGIITWGARSGRSLRALRSNKLQWLGIVGNHCLPWTALQLWQLLGIRFFGSHLQATKVKGYPKIV